MGVGFGVRGERSGSGKGTEGMGSADMNHEWKVLLKGHIGIAQFITIRNNERGCGMEGLV